MIRRATCRAGSSPSSARASPSAFRFAIATPVKSAQAAPLGCKLASRANRSRSKGALAFGAFADATFPAPKVSAYEERASAWVMPVMDGMEHHN